MGLWKGQGGISRVGTRGASPSPSSSRAGGEGGGGFPVNVLAPEGECDSVACSLLGGGKRESC